MQTTNFSTFASDRPTEPTGHPSPGLALIPGGWLTPGEVAREAGVTPRTVQNWCDRGLLRCERLPSGHRRIPARAWELFKAGGSRAEQDVVADERKRREELDRLIRKATSPQEVMDLLRGAP